MSKKGGKSTIERDFNKPNSAEQQLFDQFKTFLKQQHPQTLKKIIKEFEKDQKQIQIPLSVFQHPKLSALESLCKYLKEERLLRFSEIANLLNRDDRTVWKTYDNAIKKKKSHFAIPPASRTIPLALLTQRPLTILESLILYLKDDQTKSTKDIASLLLKKPKTVWATYTRAKKKHG